MNYIFFYISIALIWLVLLICTYFKPIEKADIIIGIVTAAVSLLYDTTFGKYFGLYHYITPSVSMLYLILAGIFIYAPSNIIYTMFLPVRLNSAAVYTIIWIALMMLFEYISIMTGTVVFTGWNPFPWSPITYTATYTWVNILYRNLSFNKIYA